MKYLTGSLLTLVTLFFITRLMFRSSKEEKLSGYKYSQSHIHSIISPLLPPANSMKKRTITQAIKHFDKTNLRVIIIDEVAYWIKDNVLYSGNITPEGIDKSSATVVDTMSMDKVQLDKVLFVVDQLREGKENDRGNSGY